MIIIVSDDRSRHLRLPWRWLTDWMTDWILKFVKLLWFSSFFMCVLFSWAADAAASVLSCRLSLILSHHSPRVCLSVWSSSEEEQENPGPVGSFMFLRFGLGSSCCPPNVSSLSWLWLWYGSLDVDHQPFHSHQDRRQQHDRRRRKRLSLLFLSFRSVPNSFFFFFFLGCWILCLSSEGDPKDTFGVIIIFRKKIHVLIEKERKKNKNGMKGIKMRWCCSTGSSWWWWGGAKKFYLVFFGDGGQHRIHPIVMMMIIPNGGIFLAQVFALLLHRLLLSIRFLILIRSFELNLRRHIDNQRKETRERKMRE